MPLGFHLLLEAGAIDFDLPLGISADRNRTCREANASAAEPASCRVRRFATLRPRLERVASSRQTLRISPLTSSR
jgi:hypothetical protein